MEKKICRNMKIRTEKEKELRNIKRGWSDVLHPLTIQSLAAVSAA